MTLKSIYQFLKAEVLDCLSFRYFGPSMALLRLNRMLDHQANPFDTNRNIYTFCINYRQYGIAIGTKLGKESPIFVKELVKRERGIFVKEQVNWQPTSVGIQKNWVDFPISKKFENWKPISMKELVKQGPINAQNLQSQNFPRVNVSKKGCHCVFCSVPNKVNEILFEFVAPDTVKKLLDYCTVSSCWWDRKDIVLKKAKVIFSFQPFATQAYVEQIKATLPQVAEMTFQVKLPLVYAEGDSKLAESWTNWWTSIPIVGYELCSIHLIGMLCGKGQIGYVGIRTARGTDTLILPGKISIYVRTVFDVKHSWSELCGENFMMQYQVPPGSILRVYNPTLSYTLKRRRNF
eukprot:TRINITY_DN4535_c0_g1_i1.p1 TRINITY_DN4535_c0_g1~~TRINITY_DN4535_c0_g1_i1.p1  ORF type:complete len:406 (+),score=30.15 TRINITY_DN4535_c0_g1_i1:175-1218(+)